MAIRQPICCECHVEMTVILNDIPIVHYNNDNIDEGVDAYVHGDIYQCPTCKRKIATGFGETIIPHDDIMENSVLSQSHIYFNRRGISDIISLVKVDSPSVSKLLARNIGTQNEA